MVRRRLRNGLAATFVLTGCSALLDAKDIEFDPNAVAGTWRSRIGTSSPRPACHRPIYFVTRASGAVGKIAKP